MAINYLNKLCESTSLTNPGVVTLTNGCAANSLVCIGIVAKRSGVVGAVLSVSDSAGNSYTVYNNFWAYNARATVAYCRTPTALTTSHTITVTYNGALTDAWISAHAYDNALGTRYHEVSNGSLTGTTPQVTVDVTGSDWLTFGVFYFPNVGGGITITPVNSSVSRDDTTGSEGEVFSRNGTTGTTHTIGGTIPSSAAWLGTAVSFLVDPSGSGTGNKRGQPTLVGV